MTDDISEGPWPCRCQEVDTVRHRHYDKHPFACARCACAAYDPVVPLRDFEAAHRVAVEASDWPRYIVFRARLALSRALMELADRVDSRHRSVSWRDPEHPHDSIIITDVPQRD